MRLVIFFAAVAMLMVLLTLNGCAVLDVARTKAAAGFDASLVAAETVTCNDASIGSIKRKYCQTTEGCQRWKDFCSAYTPTLPDLEPVK